MFFVYSSIRLKKHIRPSLGRMCEIRGATQLRLI